MSTGYLDPLEVHGVHDGALEEGDGGEMSLDQPLQLQARRSPGRAELASGVKCLLLCFIRLSFKASLKYNPNAAVCALHF